MKTSAELFEHARKTVPDVSAALNFLRAHKLVPAEGAPSPEGLLTGLLHFAEATPAAQLASQGLVAFALYARTVLDNATTDLLARTVAERVEEAVGCRIDSYAEDMGERVRKASEGIGEARAELEAEHGNSGRYAGGSHRRRRRWAVCRHLPRVQVRPLPPRPR